MLTNNSTNCPVDNDVLLQEKLEQQNSKINQFLTLQNEKKKLLFLLLSFAFGMLVNVCIITFIVLSALHFKFSIGINADTNAEIYANAWMFLVGFLVLNLVIAGVCCMYGNLINCSYIVTFACSFFSLFSSFYILKIGVKKYLDLKKTISILDAQLLRPQEKSEVFYLVLVGLMLGIFIFLKFIFSYFKVLGNGWSIEADVMFYVLALVAIDKVRYNLLFAFLAPLIGLALSSGLLYFLQVITEYLVAYWILIPIMFFYNYKTFVEKSLANKSKKTINVVILVSFAVFTMILFALKTYIHTVAGVIWWTNGDWITSIILNCQVILGSFGICLPFALTALIPIIKLRENQLSPKLKEWKIKEA